MKINKEIVEALNPCKDRFDNFLAHYPNFEGNLKDFLSLDRITYNDKVWVVTRLFTKEQNIKWAILCAYSVLDKFESIYPDDKRPRQALEAAQAYLDNPCEATLSAAGAAWSAAESAAKSAAEAAAEAAAESAAEAAAWSAAWSAAERDQKNLNLMLMLEAEEQKK